MKYWILSASPENRKLLRTSRAAGKQFYEIFFKINRSREIKIDLFSRFVTVEGDSAERGNARGEKRIWIFWCRRQGCNIRRQGCNFRSLIGVDFQFSLRMVKKTV